MEVLERFEGFVDGIRNGIAYVTLKSEHGDTLWGRYEADKLAEHGIYENRRFKCQTVDIDGDVAIQFEAIPPVLMTREEEMELDRQLRVMLGDDNEPQNDY